jgi:medium-chain acyl-[acyl-carrier-protein] hydrolase
MSAIMIPQTPANRWWHTAKSRARVRLRLFCFPYAGGSASLFWTWQVGLQDWVSVTALQLPGRANRIQEAPFTSMSDLIPIVGHSMIPLLTHGSFAFFGHSMGAVLGFEVARWLKHNGFPTPKSLFVAGRRAPQIPDTEHSIHGLDDSEFIANLANNKGTPTHVLNNRELMTLMLPTLRADFRLIETYEYYPDAPLCSSIVAFGGTDDDETRDGKLDAWKAQTTQTFRRHQLQGDHFFIHTNEQELLRLLRRELEAIQWQP